MKTKMTSLGTLAIILASAVIMLVGCHRHNDPQQRMERMARHLSWSLDLEDAQEEKLKAMIDQLQQERKKLTHAMDAIAEEIINQSKNSKFDAKAVNQMVDQKKQDFKTFRELFVVKMGEFHTMLTPKQRKEMTEKLEKINEYRKK